MCAIIHRPSQKGHQLEIARDYDDPPGFEVRQIDDYIGKIFFIYIIHI